MVRAPRTTRIGILAGAGLLAAATVLTGCGGSDPASAPTTGAGAASESPAASAPAKAVTAPAVPAGPHNDTDITFASSMIPHNVQALAVTQIASSKAVGAEVKAVVKQIGDTQVPQIEAMSAWLAGWGQPVPGGMTAKSGAGITQADLTQLSKATKGFDKLWLTTMIKHQEAAVTLAQAEVKSGTNEQAKALAQKIIKEQQAQIATMKDLLKTA